MKTLYINNGFTVNTDNGCYVITEPHFDAYYVTEYTADDDGNLTRTGTAYKTAADIKQDIHRFTGEAFDRIEYTLT